MVAPDKLGGGALVFVQASGPGVIYLRILPAMVQPVHTELARVLTLYTEQQLQSSLHRRRTGPAPHPKGLKPLADDQRLPRAELDRFDLLTAGVLTAGVLTAGPPQNQFSIRLADG